MSLWLLLLLLLLHCLQVSEMVYEESVRCGKVLGIAVPVPPPEVPDEESSRVYIKYGTTAEATKCKEMMDGRLFDDNKVSRRLARPHSKAATSSATGPHGAWCDRMPPTGAACLPAANRTCSRFAPAWWTGCLAWC